MIEAHRVRFRIGLALLVCLGPAIGRAATVVVNDAGDALHAPGCATTGTGTCTLRDAITFANANSGLDTIGFAIGSGQATILPATALPDITGPVVIDGTTQPGFAGSPLIVLDGQNLVGTVDGLRITAAGCTVRGLVVNDFPGNGISLQGASNRISGNYIGTDVFGASAKPNSGHGLSVTARTNTIGGTVSADRNVISGNLGDGIHFDLPSGGGNLVQGNYIGTDRTGLAAIGNHNGIMVVEQGINVIGGSTATPGTPPGNLISGNHAAGILTFVFSGSNTAQTVVLGNLIGTNATGISALGNQGDGVLVSAGRSNVIGGASPGERNVISGNSNGVHITNAGLSISFDNVVEGNYIGTDILGTSPVGNVFSGVLLDSTFQNVIGGTKPGQGNLISGNGDAGVGLQSAFEPATQNRIIGNRIGTDASATLPLPNGFGVGVFSSDNAVGEPGAGNIIAFNTGPGVLFNGQGDAIRGNAIFSNGGLGIDTGSGVALNDPCDLDLLQNFPVLTSATGGGLRTRVVGTLNSRPSETFDVDFYANSACDPSGHGEGQRFLGSALVVTDGSCDSSFDVSLPGQTAAGEVVTATATDQFNNTSQFSACVPVHGLGFNTVAPCRVADTRTPESAPALVANSDRTFLVGGRCGIPMTAQAVAFNFAVTQPTSPGHVTVYPGGTALPPTSTINYSAGQTRANNAVVPLGVSGDILVRPTQGGGTVHFIIDVYGYFE